LPARLWTTLVTQYGTGYYRFVGRARSADRRWPTYQVTGASFPATGLEDPSGKRAWAGEQRACLEELHQRLLPGGMATGRAGRALVVVALPATGGGADRRRAAQAGATAVR
jgi:hypothetical protein